MKNPEPVDAHAAVHAAASVIRSVRYLTAFTGAGISVESGIPPFRGPGGLWSRYDPRTLELEYFPERRSRTVRTSRWPDWRRTAG